MTLSITYPLINSFMTSTDKNKRYLLTYLYVNTPVNLKNTIALN